MNNKTANTPPVNAALRDHDEWPNTVRTREDLDTALEKGLASGVSPYTIGEITQQTLAKRKHG